PVWLGNTQGQSKSAEALKTQRLSTRLVGRSTSRSSQVFGKKPQADLAVTRANCSSRLMSRHVRNCTSFSRKPDPRKNWNRRKSAGSQPAKNRFNCSGL